MGMASLCNVKGSELAVYIKGTRYRARAMMSLDYHLNVLQIDPYLP